MLPIIFGESLFDDWFDFPFRGFESDVDRKLYGKHAARVMKTDLKEHDEGYELKVDLPGFKKDQIDLQLQNGYLTITASKGLEEEGKDKKGKIVHQERYSGSRYLPAVLLIMSRERRSQNVVAVLKSQESFMRKSSF